MAKPKEQLATEPWLEDEEAFRKHFDMSHADFCVMMEALGENYSEKYEEIREVNAEAAVLWLIHEGKQHGIVKSVE